MFLRKGGFTRILKMRTKEEQQSLREGVSQESGESLRRGVLGKGRKHQKGGPQEGGQASQRDGPGGESLRKGSRPRALGQRDFT